MKQSTINGSMTKIIGKYGKFTINVDTVTPPKKLREVKKARSRVRKERVRHMP
jgi:hypothetical protein